MSLLLPISLVAEHVYCRRGAWLAYASGQFQANEFTVEGELLHARVHAGGRATSGGKRQWRRVPVGSSRLGVVGYADLVEEAGGALYVVEYKRGPVRERRSDMVQVCLEALCLAEMTGRPVPEGRIFYAASRRRVSVPTSGELAAEARAAVHNFRADLSDSRPPFAHPGPRCFGCSHRPACLVDGHAALRAFRWEEWIR